MAFFHMFKNHERIKHDNIKNQGAPEYIICGLGNPGSKYENTRHNCGFMAVDALSDEFSCAVKKLKFKSLTGMTVINGKKCFLMKPTTYMNLSGQALREAMSFFKLPPQNALIIYDDINGNVGDIKIKRNGSDGGHNGMKNIIYLMGRDEFPRIKIGIGNKPHPDYPLADWVTSPFKKDEGEMLTKSLKDAVSAVSLIVGGEMDRAMNIYNKKNRK